ncbi:MAG: HlyD family efflux transporter periplasmic adaptor subunit [Pirellulales bacterium]
MQTLIELVTELGLLWLAGTTLLMAAGALLIGFARSPAYRQRLGELTVAASLAWIAFTLLPLPRLGLLDGWIAQQEFLETEKHSIWPELPIPSTPSDFSDADEVAALELALSDVLAGAPVFAADSASIEQTPLAGAPPEPPATPLLNLDSSAIVTQIASAPDPSETEAAAPPIDATIIADSGPATVDRTTTVRVIVLVYLTAAACCVLWLLIGRCILLVYQWTARPPEPWLAELYESLSLPASWRRAQVLVVARAGRPISYGLLQPRIVIPAELAHPRHRDTLRHVLLHEAAHTGRGDAWGHALLNAAFPVLFFHPLYWWLRREVQFARELIADDWAAAASTKRAYVEDLIQLARQRRMIVAGPISVLGLIAFRSPFYRRMKMLIDREKPLASRISRRWTLITTAGALGLALLLAAALAPDRAGAQQSEEGALDDGATSEGDALDETTAPDVGALVDPAAASENLSPLEPPATPSDESGEAADPTSPLDSAAFFQDGPANPATVPTYNSADPPSGDAASNPAAASDDGFLYSDPQGASDSESSQSDPTRSDYDPAATYSDVARLQLAGQSAMLRQLLGFYMKELEALQARREGDSPRAKLLRRRMDAVRLLLESELDARPSEEPAEDRTLTYLKVAMSKYLGVVISKAENGFRIDRVLENSPAEKAGLRRGDVVLSLNDRAYFEEGKFAGAFLTMKPDDKVRLLVISNGQVVPFAMEVARTRRVRRDEIYAPAPQPGAADTPNYEPGERQTWPRSAKTQKLSGLIVAANDVTVPVRVDGIITELKVEEGAKVEKGQLLASLDPQAAELVLKVAEVELQGAQIAAEANFEIRSLEKELETAEANLDQTMNAIESVPGSVSETEIRRLRALREQTAIQLEAAQSNTLQEALRLEAQQAKLRAAKEALARYRVVAPIDGVVTSIESRSGEWIAQGEALCRIVDLSRLKVETRVPANMANAHKLTGQEATVTVRLAEDEAISVPAKVTFVSPTIDQLTGFLVHVNIENKQANGGWLLRPGMNATVEIDLGGSSAAEN